MTASATHRRAAPRVRSPRGFSILEILVALALVGLLAATVVMSIPGLMSGLGSRPMPEILQKAVRDARYQAALRKEMVTLRFDHETGAFVIADPSGATIASRDSGYGADYAGVRVQFYQILPAKGLSSLAREGELVKIDAVRFSPDRSSTPFVAQIDADNVRSRHRFDPFSDLEIKDE